MHGFDSNDELCKTPLEDIVADSNAIVVLANHLISKLTTITELHQQIQKVFVLGIGLYKLFRSVTESFGMYLKRNIDGHEVG